MTETNLPSSPRAGEGLCECGFQREVVKLMNPPKIERGACNESSHSGCEWHYLPRFRFCE